ncbi:MAG TPA: hypothetical protein VF006_10440 [Longimicrobium sp.]
MDAMAKSGIRHQLRELRTKAWEAELGEALLPIADLFDAWRRGEASAFDLTEAIHRFHQGESREIWKKHQSRDTEMLLAQALADGHLRREQIPDPVYEVLEPYVAQLAMLRAAGESTARSPEVEDEETS